MKKLALLIALFVLSGCSHTALFAKDDTKEYSNLEVTLASFSMTIVASYERQGRAVPNDFSESQFFQILEKNYPDKKQVEAVKNGYLVKARPLGTGYSVMLCDRDSGFKIMEDLSCHMNRVELRYWDKPDPSRCLFEDNWEPFCR